MKDHAKQADELRIEATAADLEERRQRSLVDDGVEEAEFRFVQVVTGA